MKLLCDTVVVNRQCPNLKSSSVKSTLAIGYHPPGKENAELFIIHFTLKNKSGLRYKVKNNLNKIFTKFVNDGKATISFKLPEHDLQIKCDPIQLKCFLKALKLGLEGKQEMNKIGLSSLAVTPVSNKKHPVTKLCITSRADYPTKGFPKTLQTLSIIGLRRERLEPSILALRNLHTLNLSDNKFSKLPKDIGNIPLVDIDVSNNCLGESLDADNWNWLDSSTIKKSLQNLNLSNNKLKSFPYKLVKLNSLTTLKIDNNMISSIPFGLRRLRSLRYLYLSTNKLVSLPESLNHLRLDLLDVWGNEFMPKSELEDVFPAQKPKKIIVPALWELAARVVISKKISYSSRTIPWILVDILSEVPLCICGNLCYNTEVHRRSMVMCFDNVKELIFSRDRVIYADCVICSDKCTNRLVNFQRN